MSAMNGAEAKIARGIVRCESRISSPMKDADSTPVQAKAIVDQKIRSRSRKPGTIASGVQALAEPNRHQTPAPTAIRISVASQRATDPTLKSHLPVASPHTLTSVASASPAVAATM